MNARREAQLDQQIDLNNKEIKESYQPMEGSTPEMKTQLESYVESLKQENAQLRREMNQLHNSYNR